MVVEDDENDAIFLRMGFKKAGLSCALHVAQDGRQAIDYLEGKGAFSNRTEFPLPYLILLDLKLPHVMGLDVLKWIRSTPGIGFHHRHRDDLFSASFGCGVSLPPWDKCLSGETIELRGPEADAAIDQGFLAHI